MVSSSKKKRGKQRKAAKQQQTTGAAASTPQTNLDPNDISLIYDPQGATYYHPTHHKLAALYVQKADNQTTEAMISLTDKDLPIHGISYPNISLVQSGIVSTVLNFLGRCEHETFDKVLIDARGHVFTLDGSLITNVGGDLETPSTWIKVLMRAAELEPSCMLQIVESIGPLVSCMCNDMTRLFFQSNKHWREGVAQFAMLVLSILMKTANNDEDPANGTIVEALLHHQGLLTSIVQWGYWVEERRPDISKELNNDMPCIVRLGRVMTEMLLRDAYKLSNKNISSRIQAIGITPIVNKEHNPNCMVSYTAEKVRLAKIKQDKNSLTTVLVLIEESCVDKDIISEVIDLGMNVTDFNTVPFVFLLSNAMVCQYESRYKCPNDTRVAFAIREGLIEMCLTLVKRFWENDSVAGNYGEISLSNYIQAVFDLVHKVSLHQKTAKAIRSKRDSISEKLVSLEGDERISSNPGWKELLDMVRYIISINGSKCCRCNKSLSRTEVKQCNRCSLMTYCSEACQRRDWFNGHDMACKGECGRHMGQFQGRYWPVTAPDNERAAQKMEELEKNISMIQLKLFLVNSNTILSQAEALSIPLHDCVVHFDLRQCPIEVETFEYSNERFYGSSRGHLDDFEISRSMDNITCVYVSSFYNGELLEDGQVPKVCMQRMFPHEWLNDPFGDLFNDEDVSILTETVGAFEF